MTFLQASYPVIEYYESIGINVLFTSDQTFDEVYEETKKKMNPIAHPNIVFVLGRPGSGKGSTF
jgi:adenylate kinase